MIAYSNVNYDDNISDSSGTTPYKPNTVWIMSDNASGGTKIQYDDGIIFYNYDFVTPKEIYFDDFDFTRKAINAEKSKWILRDGPRMVFRPKKQVDRMKPIPVYRIMRCHNRSYHQKRHLRGLECDLRHYRV